MILVKDNVEREAETEREITRLKKKGFVELKNDEAPGEQEAPGESELQIDLDDMKLDDLKALAKEKGLTGVSALNKEQLLEVLKGME